ncbi:MAG: cupin domain-containing protein [Chloroflexota bacterium]
MTLEVTDFRKDVRNVLITPEIRSRFMRLGPGESGSAHTHDLGHEVFLILDGQAEFIIDGDRAVLSPGQLCVALAGQMHEVHTVGDKPMTMYLSVTPHIEPTHTFWDDHGNQLPPRYGGSTRAEREAAGPPTAPTQAVLDAHLAMLASLSDQLAQARQSQSALARRLKAAQETGDNTASKAALDAIWAELLPTFRLVGKLAENWNDLATRIAG